MVVLIEAEFQTKLFDSFNVAFKPAKNGKKLKLLYNSSVFVYNFKSIGIFLQRTRKNLVQNLNLMQMKV